MALATRCPHCQTTFRVAHDQLKLRAGLVRCGACKEIFNGIEHLLRPGEGAPGTIPAAPAPAPAAIPAAIPAAPVAVAPDVKATDASVSETSESASQWAPPFSSAPSAANQSLPDQHREPTAQDGAATAKAPAVPHQPDHADDASDAANTEAATPPDSATIDASTHTAPLAERFFDAADLYPAFDLIAPTPASAFSDPDPNNDDPLQRMTLIQFSDDESDQASDDDPDHVARQAALHDAGDTSVQPAAYAQAVVSPHAGVSSDTSEPMTDAPGLIAASAHPADELDRAIDHLQRRPWRGSKKKRSREDVESSSEFDSDAEEPSFITRARRREGARAGLRSWQTWLMLLLLLAALAQTIFALRDQIAARLPSARPWLLQACAVLDCQVDLPAQADAISIESNELTALNPGKNTFGLTLVLRNRGAIVQRWPNIELTLLDASERPVIRKVFGPADYLPSATDPSKGFAANSEQTARIAFELRQQKASNYRVYPFYP